MKEKECELCKEKFLARWDCKSYGQRFCSVRCRTNYQVKNNIGFSSKEVHSKAGKKRVHQLHPDLAKQNWKLSREVIKEKGILIGWGALKKKDSERFDEFIKKVVNKSIETRKEKKIGFYDSNFQKEMSKRATKKQREEKRGFFNPELLKEMLKKGMKTRRERKIGVFNNEFQREMNRRSMETFKKHPEIWIEGGKKAGVKSEKSRRENSPYIWEGVNFLSKMEMIVAKNILTKPIVGVNCHINVNGKIIDFFPQEDDKMFKGKFVEFHPWDRKLTQEEYKLKREEIIKNSQYKNKELMVVTKLPKEWIK